jgi:hypothetical protein
MGRHVGHARRLTCRPGRGHSGRVADLPGRRVRPGRQGAEFSDPQLAAGESSQALDGLTGTRVVRSLSFEQRQRPLGAVSSPPGKHPSVIFAQRQCAWLAAHTGILASVERSTRNARLHRLDTSQGFESGELLERDPQPSSTALPPGPRRRG